MTMHLLTAKDVAVRLQVKVKTVYAWAHHGKIPCMKLHGLVRFRWDAIEHWLASLERTVSPRSSLPLPRFRGQHSLELDPLIAAAKRDVYTPRRGKTRAKLRPIGKEETDGVV